MSTQARIAADKNQRGVYYVEGQQWSVGNRYTLLKVLGSGSFSSVVSALDNETQEHVALKRIPDVLSNSENAKRVLREVCILRRLEHPHIIGLKDVFLKPSSTGRYMYRNGSLVPTSLDLYLALEFCEQGDLFHLKGQLSEHEVKTIMLQLLSAVQYLHRNGVWHRDIKSANILMTYHNGIRYIKLADLGSARSTLLEKHLLQATTASHPQQQQHSSRPHQLQRECNHCGHTRQHSLDSTGSGSRQQQRHDGSSRLGPSGPPVHHSDSFLADANSSPSEIYARPAPGGGGGFKSPLTRMVCTPCYRAPEVVMSRGGYTEAIDMWGIGCVFGELLQRVAWIGKATTPQLQVAPVFAIHGLPPTPGEGEHYAGGPGNSITRTELSALFSVIGVPSWRCIESVTSPAWRRYLRKVPPKAPTLFRRFGSAGEVAVDLLARLLAFDSAHRCSCEEALAHEYFEDLVRTDSPDIGHMDPVVQQTVTAAAVAANREEWMVDDDQHASEDEDDDHRSRSLQPPPRPQSVLKRARSLSMESPPRIITAAAAGGDSSGQLPGLFGTLPDPFTAAAAAAAASVGLAGGAGGSTNGRHATDDMDVDHKQQQPPSPAAAAAGVLSPTPHLPPLPPKAAAPTISNALPPAAAAAGGCGSSVSLSAAAPAGLVVSPSGQHYYYEFDDPAAALAALEQDMAALMTVVDHEQVDTAPGGPPPQAPQPLRELLEREVQEHQNHLERRRNNMAMTADKRSSDGSAPRSPPPLSPFSSANAAAAAAGNSSIARQWQHLLPDPGPSMDASRIGFQRLPHHADAEQAHLEPEQHLRVGRHGEWAQDALKAGPRSGTVWGVSLVPSGYSEESHPEIADIVRSQHKR